MEFINRMTPSPDVPTPSNEDDINEQWNEYVDEQRERELQQIIEEENLHEDETRKFMDQSFADGYVTTTGVAITKVLPPLPIFGGVREAKKQTVLDKLCAFFTKYFNI